MNKRYVERLAGLDEGGFPPAVRASRLLLLTGQSSFASSRLRPEQRAFLDEVAPPGADVVPSGFPWHDALDRSAGRQGLLAASWRNLCQWHWTRGDNRYVAVVKKVIALVRDRTEGPLLVATGSCGIQLLAAGLGDACDDGPAIHVLALGPVGRQPVSPCIETMAVVQGRRDNWSRRLWSGPVMHQPDCGHLDYYGDPRTLAYARAFFAGEEP